MDAIKLSVEITADRRLVIDLPADTPLGSAEIVITPTEPSPVSKNRVLNPAREAARAKLLAAGKLATELNFPHDAVPLSDAELQRLGTLPAGAPSLDDLINEDRTLR